MNKRNYLITNINKYFNQKYPKLITEKLLNNKTIINVDIQPEYEEYLSFDKNEWADFINNNYESNDIIFLYNGKETLDMIDENSYKMWLLNLGIYEEVFYFSKFFDKEYAYFRFCLDESMDEEKIVNIVKFMIKYNINDSRDIDENMWDIFMKEYGHEDIKELLETAGDMINIPDLMDFLKYHSNIVLLGGGINECLKEVEIALKSLNKKYEILSQFTF